MIGVKQLCGYFHSAYVRLHKKQGKPLEGTRERAAEGLTIMNGQIVCRIFASLFVKSF
ncbi:hypothetical protein [uncultured Aquitalea sp.]|uniref:hypothetical protein n=1 Tax=uncultured Aquitalea sp. TaxID=540272 RepID=UPI0025EFC65E|nr:hypothetical protein [uncultured Aquitalea sp.]